MQADYPPDFPSTIVCYAGCPDRMAKFYLDQDEWTRRSILNMAGMGKFSNDRYVSDYTREDLKGKAVEQ